MMDRMITINLDEFLEFAKQEDCWDNYYCLDEFLENTIDKYLRETPCPECGNKIKEIKKVWSETKNWVFEYNTTCQKCGYIIKTENNRDKIKYLLLGGEVKVKDIEILKRELGLE